MPRYDYACEKCGNIEEHIHSMKESPEIKCPKCRSSMTRQISLSFGGFNIKGGSSSIHWREKRYRKKKSEKLKEKQKTKYGNPMPAPNIAGVRQESWSDCQKLAKECGLDSDSYTPMVEKERKKKNGIIV